MFAALLSLALASPDPSPAALEAIQGTWHGDNGWTMVRRLRRTRIRRWHSRVGDAIGVRARS